MAEITLVIGDKVQTTDNKVSGHVKSVVVDPSTQTATHLVVEPKDREGLARLVPLDHVDAPADKIRLRYTEAEFKNLAAAEETLAEIPNEEEEHRGDHVLDTDDDDIGQLRALIIDSDTHQLIHVLLKEGHFPWHHKEVRIPANKVCGFDHTGIHLSITKQEVQDLAGEERRMTKIVTLKVSGEFDMDALEDGPGQALLQHDNDGWKLLTSEGPRDHGYLRATDQAQAVREARQQLESEGYEVMF